MSSLTEIKDIAAMNHIELLFLAALGTYALALLLFLIGIYFPPKTRMQRRPTISLIIAARNEEENIGFCLADLQQQTYPIDLFEIIVVDDHSSDRTAELVRQFQARLPHLRLLNAGPIPENLTPKKNAINQGIKNSKGDIILTTDADCRVKPTWIESMVSYFTDEVGMVVGFSQFIGRDHVFSFLESLQALDFVSMMATAAGSSNLGFPLAASGQNLAYRRQAFEEVGGFKFIGHRVSGDDVLLLQLIRSLTHWKIRFADSPDSFNATYARKTIGEVLNQRRRWASNAPFQIKLNKLFFVFLLNAFAANVGILLGLPLMAIDLISWQTLLAGFGIKAMAEFLIAVRACTKFGRPELLRLFPAWLFIQIPYVFLAGLLGCFGTFTWKDRKHDVHDLAFEPFSKR